MVALAVVACVVPAGAANFGAGSQVNVVRLFDADLVLQSQAQWSNYVGHIGAPASLAIDSACSWAQINGGDGASNYGCFDVTLDKPVSISSIYTDFMNNHLPVQYQLWVSTTGFENMTPLFTAPKAPDDSGKQTDTFVPVTAQYLRMEYVGTVTQYLLLGEFKAFASDPASVSHAGYNVLADPAIGGVRLDRYDPLYCSGGWLFDPNNAVDQDDRSYLRTVEGSGAEGEQFFVKPLGQSVRLIGGTYGFYLPDSSQQWGAGMTIQVTNDATITANTQWITVWSTSSAITGSGSFFFEDDQGDRLADGIDARFIRVSTTDGVQAAGALCELEFFTPVPEPATMGLLALGGLALLRRRK